MGGVRPGLSSSGWSGRLSVPATDASAGLYAAPSRIFAAPSAIEDYDQAISLPPGEPWVIMVYYRQAPIYEKKGLDPPGEALAMVGVFLEGGRCGMRGPARKPQDSSVRA